MPSATPEVPTDPVLAAEQEHVTGLYARLDAARELAVTRRQQAISAPLVDNAQAMGEKEAAVRFHGTRIVQLDAAEAGLVLGRLDRESTPQPLYVGRTGLPADDAGGDPALVRYYFGNRETLLLEVAKQIGEEAHQSPPEQGDPVTLLTDFIHATFRFTRSARNMQRLMIDELDSTSSPEMRDNVRKWNRGPVDYYAGLKDLDEQHDLADFDPLFLHLAIVGISDFFVSGSPLVKLLVPEGTDMEELGQQYEAFVEKLLLDGLRKR